MIQLGALGICGTLAAAASSQPAAPSARAAVAAAEAPATAELVVDLDDQMTDAEIDSFAHRYKAHLLSYSRFSQKDHLFRLLPEAERQSPGSAQQSALLAALRADPHVEAADFTLTYQIPETAPGALTRPSDEALPVALAGTSRVQDDDQRGRFVPNDPKYRYQWHLDQIRMPQAWTYTRGEGVVVAVVDTGVTAVEDLQGTELVPGWNFVDDSPDARDDHGHGTHVAGTIAQTTHNGVGVAGVAYQAKIMPIKVLSGSGSGSVNGIAQGIRWAANHGAQVINMSLGGPYNSQVLARAVKYAHDKGVVVVCAAGNDGRGKVSFPAANDGAIAVAATQYDEATTFYSNWGKEIAIAAPGGNTRLDQNNDGLPDGVLQNTVTPGNIAKQDYLLFMGTSMASPHIAGVAALLVSQGVRSPEQVAQLLQKTARRPAQYRGKHDSHYGAGIVDAAAAAAAARQLVAAGESLPVAHARLRPLDTCACAHARRQAADQARGLLGLYGLGLLALGTLGLGLVVRRRRGMVVTPALDTALSGPL
jgi:serine protease